MTTLTPRFTIYKLRTNVDGIVHDTTSLTEIVFYSGETRKHMYGVIINNPYEDIFPLYSMLNKIDDLIDEECQFTEATLKRADFEEIQSKMLALTDQFIAFLNARRFEDKCIGDQDLKSFKDEDDFQASHSNSSCVQF